METRALLSLPFRLYFLEQKVSHNELFLGPIMFFFSFSLFFLELGVPKNGKT